MAAKREKGLNLTLTEADEDSQTAEALSVALRKINPGGKEATTYHRLMIGVLEFLLFPHLLYPELEKEINEGRKRIDIFMENGAWTGIFHRLHAVRSLPCNFVACECKNYVNEIANPELDQLIGRFSNKRGRLGLLCCRKFEDRDRFIKRCQDTMKDDHGVIIPLDDAAVLRLLGLVEASRRDEMDEALTAMVNEVWVS